MREVINGKLYDTATAIKVAEWDNGHNILDFHYCEETLYQTKKGVYFLNGKGGPMSEYAEHRGNESCGGNVIVALSEQDAFNWCEEKGMVSIIIERFSNKIEEA